MQVYQCLKCKHKQLNCGTCDKCHSKIRNLPRKEQRQIELYGDGGSCGCNEQGRAFCLFIIGIIAIIIGVIALVASDGNEDQRIGGIGFIGAGIVFLIAGCLCPSGCCGEYKKYNNEVELLD